MGESETLKISAVQLLRREVPQIPILYLQVKQLTAVQYPKKENQSILKYSWKQTNAQIHY